MDESTDNPARMDEVLCLNWTTWLAFARSFHELIAHVPTTGGRPADARAEPVYRLGWTWRHGRENWS